MSRIKPRAALPGVLSFTEAAARLDISTGTLERRIRDAAPEFPRPVLISGARLFCEAEIDAYRAARSGKAAA